MIQLTGTSACLMRDELSKQWFAKNIKLSEITHRLSKIEIPSWLRSEIIEMFQYRWADRIKDSVEEAMFDAVCSHIVK